MKALIVNVSLAILTLLTFSAFAEKVVITGQPVTLEVRDGVYYTPANYTVTTAYNYVDVDGTQRVCYSEAQPSLSNLNVSDITVNVGGNTVTWHCYDYNPTYFVVE